MKNKNEILKFRLSKFENWCQVFGENYWLWLVPLVIESGRPDGDGLNWKVRDTKMNELKDVNKSIDSQQNLGQGTN